MADPNSEKLKVQFEVDLEQLKRQLAAAGVEFDQFSKKTEQDAEKVKKGFDAMGQKAGFLQQKLASIGKAAAAAFAFDLAAKVLGFSGVMDVVSKATDKAADAIRVFNQQMLGIGGEQNNAEAKLKRIADRLAEIRKATRTTDVVNFGLTTRDNVPFEIPRIESDAQSVKVLEAVERTQRKLKELADSASVDLGAKSYADASDALRAYVDEILSTENEKILSELRSEIAALSKEFADAPGKMKAATDAHNAWLKSLERGAAAAARERAEAGVVRFANPFANVGATAAQTAIDRSRQVAFDRRSSEIQAAERDSARLESFVRKAIALSRAVADATSGVFEELEFARKRADFTAEQSRIFLNDYATTIERTRLQAELTADPFDQLSASLNQIADTAEQRRLNLYQQFVDDGDQEKLREFLDLVDKIEKKQADFVRSSATFGGQTERRIKEIEQSISDLGGQSVDVAFNSFRGFFRDILSGTASGSEAFRNFAASVVGGLADMLAQWLALRAVGFFFGPGFGAGGAAFGASTAAPAGVRAAGLTSPGGTGSRFGAIGGGAQVTLNLVVQSLDPRTAADVVLGAMPQIQDALTGALAGGSDRRFLEQVRLAR